MSIVKSFKRNLLMVFLLWPFVALIKAIEHYGKPFSKKIIMLFFAVYGFSFVLDPSMDGERYANRLKVAYNQPFSSFYEQLFGLYETSVDFLQPLITYIISRFTDSYNVLFAVYALIFGYFYLKSIDFVIKKIKPGKSLVSKIYIVLLVGLIPIFNINGFRMWTAAWIFILGALHVVWNKDYKFLILCLFACFMHFSFLAANAVLIVWIIAGNRPWIYLIIALITLTISEINLQSIQNVAEQISPAIDRKATAYTNEDYADKVSEGRGKAIWFMKLLPIFLKTLLISNCLILMIKFLRKGLLSKPEQNLLSFTLLFLSYANIAALVPSGGRFFSIFYVFSTILSLILLKKWRIRINSPFALVSSFIIAYFTLIILRIASPTINTVVLAPSITIPFGYSLDWSLYNVIFQ